MERVLRERVPDSIVATTEHPGHATQLAREALHNGAERIVSVGGDGTHYEVLNGFFECGALVNPRACLALLAEGTGSDITRGIGIPKGREGLDIALHGPATPVDVGRFTYRGMDGGVCTAHFLNVLHIGMGGAVTANVNRANKTFGGWASYLLGVVRTLATYRNTILTLDLDGKLSSGRFCDIAVANGRYDGGGMRLAPDALLNDGHFDVYLIRDVGRADAFANLWRLYRGTLAGRTDVVQHLPCRRLTVTGDEATPIGVEGEAPGTVPVTIENLPCALPLVVGNHAEALC